MVVFWVTSIGNKSLVNHFCLKGYVFFIFYLSNNYYKPIMVNFRLTISGLFPTKKQSLVNSRLPIIRNTYVLSFGVLYTTLLPWKGIGYGVPDTLLYFLPFFIFYFLFFIYFLFIYFLFIYLFIFYLFFIYFLFIYLG